MSIKFDPYHKWLGIPPTEQSPTLYQLLGLQTLESDADVILNAADRQMAHVKTYAMGQYSAESQQLLNELAAAKVCLVNPQRKAEYDATLARRVDVMPQGLPYAHPQVVANAQFARASQVEPAQDSPFYELLQPQIAPVNGARWSVDSSDHTLPQWAHANPFGTSTVSQRRSASPVINIIGFGLSSMLGLLLGYFILCLIKPQSDFLGWFSDPRQEVAKPPSTSVNPMLPKPVVSLPNPPDTTKQLEASLVSLMNALGERRLDEANMHLAAVRTLDRNTNRQLASATTTHRLVCQFWAVVRAQMTRLHAGDEFKYDHGRGIVVSRDAKALTVRIAGTTYDYESHRLPLWFAMALFQQRSPSMTDANKATFGVVHFVDFSGDRQRGRSFYADAIAAGSLDPRILDFLTRSQPPTKPFDPPAASPDPPTTPSGQVSVLEPSIPQEKLPIAVELPRLNVESAVELLHLAPGNEAALKLELLANPIGIGSIKTFYLAKNNAEHEFSEWDVFFAAKDERTNPIAKFKWLESKLSFRWLPANDKCPAGQLRNCILEMQLDDTTHKLQLRQPIVAPPMVLDFERNESRVAFAIADLPLEGELSLEIMDLDRLPVAAQPQNGLIGNAQTALKFLFADYPGCHLLVRFEAQPEQVAIEAGVTVKQGKAYRLSRKSLLDERRRLEKKRTIMDNELNARKQAAKETLPDELRDAQSLPIPNQPTLASIAIAHKESLIANITNRAKSNQKTIRRLEENIPGIQQAIEALNRISDFAHKMHQQAAIQFRVYTYVGKDRLELLSTASPSN
jgi:hypothetical protein